MPPDAFESLERTGSIDLVGTSTTTTRTYTVSGAADEDAALAAVLDIAPSTVGSLLPRTFDVNELGPQIWSVAIKYDWPNVNSSTPDVGDETFSFDTGGATQLITQTRFTQTTYNSSGAMGTDPFGKALNVTIDSEGKTSVEGLEIGLPALSFQIRRRFANADLTFGYLRTLVLASFSTNNATFRGFAAGEVLFTHASGSQSTDGDPEITFNFIGSPNLTGLTIGDIAGISKKGHEYLWVYSAPKPDVSNLLVIPRPKYVSVSQIYESSNFGAFGIATS